MSFPEKVKTKKKIRYSQKEGLKKIESVYFYLTKNLLKDKEMDWQL
ncbi:MAG: hypothetical protein CM15mP75_2420 [Flammeovirgaceae bacterium]|nr:MAG: hypothetical protein CM15mP75_2420 [Flammeovirgaceae bacterium]